MFFHCNEKWKKNTVLWRGFVLFLKYIIGSQHLFLDGMKLLHSCFGKTIIQINFTLKVLIAYMYIGYWLVKYENGNQLIKAIVCQRNCYH